MQGRWKVHVAVCGACVVLACDGAARDPVAPDLAATSVSRAVAVSDSASTGGPKASGRADIHGTPVQGIRDETYSFIAIPASTLPLATGRVEAHFLTFAGAGATVHAEVTCVSIVGNQAWLGSRVTRFVLDGEDVPARIGGPMVFRVQDRGQGHGVTDLASLLFFAVPSGLPPGSSELDYCSTRLAFPNLRESTNGDIHVKPE